MIDGIVENEEGEVIDAHDAPKRLLFIPGASWNYMVHSVLSDGILLYRYERGDVGLNLLF